MHYYRTISTLLSGCLVAIKTSSLPGNEPRKPDVWIILCPKTFNPNQVELGMSKRSQFVFILGSGSDFVVLFFKASSLFACNELQVKDESKQKSESKINLRYIFLILMVNVFWNKNMQAKFVTVVLIYFRLRLWADSLLYFHLNVLRVYVCPVPSYLQSCIKYLKMKKYFTVKVSFLYKCLNKSLRLSDISCIQSKYEK